MENIVLKTGLDQLIKTVMNTKFNTLPQVPRKQVWTVKIQMLKFARNSYRFEKFY